MRSDPPKCWNVSQKFNNIPEHTPRGFDLIEPREIDSISDKGVYAEGNRTWDFAEKLHIHC